MMSGVYHIHSQADAQAELDRQRLMQRVRDARKKQRGKKIPFGRLNFSLFGLRIKGTLELESVKPLTTIHPTMKQK